MAAALRGSVHTSSSKRSSVTIRGSVPRRFLPTVKLSTTANPDRPMVLAVLPPSCHSGPALPARSRQLRAAAAPATPCGVGRAAARSAQAAATGGAGRESPSGQSQGQGNKASATVKSIERLLGLDEMESSTPAAVQELPLRVQPAPPPARRRVRRRCRAACSSPPRHSVLRPGCAPEQPSGRLGCLLDYFQGV